MEKEYLELKPALESISVAERIYIDAWNGFKSGKLQLEVRKGKRLIELESELNPETKKKMYSNADSRKAKLDEEFLKDDLRLINIETELKEKKLSVDLARMDFKIQLALVKGGNKCQ